MRDLINDARLFATAAHGAINQRRKYTGEPYINHPKRVADLISDYLAGDILYEYAIAAAWLHDVVEDTKVPIETINAEFGLGVGRLVADLTNVEASAGNRRERFHLNLKRLENSHPAAASIKLADIIDNTSSIVTHDPKFGAVYLTEKVQVLDVLSHGDQELWKKAYNTIMTGRQALMV